MIERYGRDMEMQKIRSLDDERKYNERDITAADAFYAGDGCKPGSIDLKSCKGWLQTIRYDNE